MPGVKPRFLTPPSPRSVHDWKTNHRTSAAILSLAKAKRMNMHIQHVTGAKLEAVRTTARKIFDAHEGDKQKTIDALIKRAETSARLRSELIRLGAATLAGTFVHQERASLIRGVDPEQIRFTTSGVNVVPPVMSFRQAEQRRRVARNNVVRAWLTFRLPTEGNKRLGSATVKDLADGADAYRRQSGDMIHKATWLDAIRAKMPKGKTVAEVLDDRALDALYNSVAA